MTKVIPFNPDERRAKEDGQGDAQAIHEGPVLPCALRVGPMSFPAGSSMAQVQAYLDLDAAQPIRNTKRLGEAQRALREIGGAISTARTDEGIPVGIWEAFQGNLGPFMQAYEAERDHRDGGETIAQAATAMFDALEAIITSNDAKVISAENLMAAAQAVARVKKYQNEIGLLRQWENG